MIQELEPDRLLELLDSFHFTNATYHISRPPVQDFNFFLTRAEWPGKVDGQLLENLLWHAEKGYEAETQTGVENEKLEVCYYSRIVDAFQDDQPSRNVVVRSCRAWCLVWACAPLLTRATRRRIPADVEVLTAAVQMWESLLARWPLKRGETRSALDLQRRMVMLARGDAQALLHPVPAAPADRQAYWESTWTYAGHPDEIDESDPPGWVEYDSEDEEPLEKSFVRPYLCYVLGMQHIVTTNQEEGYRWLEQAIHWLPTDALATRLELSFLLLEELAGCSAMFNARVSQLKEQINLIAEELGPVQLAKWKLRLAEVDELVDLDPEELVLEAKRLLETVAAAPSLQEPYEYYEFHSAHGKCLMLQNRWADAASSYGRCLSVAKYLKASQGSRLIGTGIGSGSNMYRDAFLFATMCEARVRLQLGDTSGDYVGAIMLPMPTTEAAVDPQCGAGGTSSIGRLEHEMMELRVAASSG